MGKWENDRIQAVLNDIKVLEKKYGVTLTRIACLRYYTRKSAEFKLKKEISKKEKELLALKTKVK
jgi:hypothetical protein